MSGPRSSVNLSWAQTECFRPLEAAPTIPAPRPPSPPKALHCESLPGNVRVSNGEQWDDPHLWSADVFNYLGFRGPVRKNN